MHPMRLVADLAPSRSIQTVLSLGTLHEVLVAHERGPGAHIHLRKTRRISSRKLCQTKLKPMMGMMEESHQRRKRSSNGTQWTECACGAMMRSCSISTQPLRFGATRSSAGQVCNPLNACST